jgi:hypothetical protein
MESAGFWKKLLPDLCDNSNRKILFADAAFFRKICREDGHSGEMPWRNLAAQQKSADFRIAGKKHPRRTDRVAWRTHTAGERGKKRCGTILF